MTDKQNKLIPKLRFPEFKNDGEWEQKFVKDVCSIETGKSNTQDQDVNGLYPFFIRSENPVKSSKYLYDCEAVITIGDGKIGQVFHYINGKFDLHQRCYKMSDFQGVNGKYFFYFFSSHFYERAMRMSAKATVDSVRLEMISDMPIYLPSLKEQKRIADFLTSLDDLLTGTKSILEQLKVHKKGLMQKLFPAPGETTPEYRFADCNNGSEWPVKRLGELFCRIVEKNTENNQNVLTISAQFGLVSQSDYFHKSVSSNDITNYFLIQRGDFAYNKSRSQGYPYGTVKSLQLYEKGVVSPLYLCFRPRNVKTNTLFYGYYFESESFNLELGRVAQEGARNHGLLNISPSDFFDSICVAIPQPKEQERIAQSLFSIDSLILSYSNRLFQIERYKNGLLQQLFPSFE